MNHPFNSSESLNKTLQNLQREFSDLEKKKSKLDQLLKQEQELTLFQRQEIESLTICKKSLKKVNRKLLKENEKLKEDATRNEEIMQNQRNSKLERLKHKKNQFKNLLRKANAILDEYQKFFDHLEESRFDFSEIPNFYPNDFIMSVYQESKIFSYTDFSSIFPSSFSLPSTTFLSSSSDLFSSLFPHEIVEKNLVKGEFKKKRTKKTNARYRNEKENTMQSKMTKNEMEGNGFKFIDLAHQIFSRELSLNRNLDILKWLSMNSYNWLHNQRESQEIRADKSFISDGFFFERVSKQAMDNQKRETMENRWDMANDEFEDKKKTEKEEWREKEEKRRLKEETTRKDRRGLMENEEKRKKEKGSNNPLVSIIDEICILDNRLKEETPEWRVKKEELKEEEEENEDNKRRNSENESISFLKIIDESWLEN